MSTMNLLSATATLPEIISTAEKLGLDIVEDGGLFTVYRFGNWYASFTGTETLLEIVNFRISLDNDKEIERKEQAARESVAALEAQVIQAEINARISSMTEGFTPAAVLNQAGKVIAVVKADPKAHHITLVDGVFDGVAINARERKISRSGINLGKCKYFPQLAERVLNNCVVYEFYD